MALEPVLTMVRAKGKIRSESVSSVPERTVAMSRLRLSDFDYDLPRELIAQAPARERTGSRLLHVDGAMLADLAFADLPRLRCAGRSSRLQRHARDQVAAASRRNRPAAGSSSCSSALHRRPRGAVPASREPSAEDRQHAAPARASTQAEVVERRRPLLRVAASWRRRVPRLSRPARRGAAAAVHRARRGGGRRDALPDRLRATCGRRRRADGGAAFRRRAAVRARGRRRRLRLRHAARRRRHLRAGHTRGHRRAHDARRVVPVPAATAAAIDATRARGGRVARGRHDQPCARSSPPPTNDGRVRAGDGGDADLHHARLPIPGRRAAAHELPSAALDAADARLGVRRLSTRSAPPTRTRSRSATASTATATRCCSRPR